MNILICLNIFKINIEQSRPSSWKIQDLAIKLTLLTVQCTTKKDNMMKTFTLMMILSLGVLHCQTAERRPPPPPGFNDKGSSGSFGPPGLPSSFGGPSVQALKPNGGSGGGRGRQIIDDFRRKVRRVIRYNFYDIYPAELQ